MFYALRLCSKYEEVFALDAAEEQNEINKGKVAKRQINNVFPHHVLVNAEWIKENESLFDGADVLLTEVVEHMPQAEAQALVEAILKTKYRKLVITTPNKDFNQFYGMAEEEFRHSDHDWEIPLAEFGSWTCQILENSDLFGCQVYGIGDSVNNVSVTSMAVIEGRKTQTTAVTTILEIADPEPDTSPSSTEPVEPSVPARQLEDA
jgi:hypothetical protein